MTDTVHRLRGAPGLVVHRREGFRVEAPHAAIRNGVPITRVEQTIVDCWPLLDQDAGCGATIHAV